MKDVRLIATDMDHTLLTEAGELPAHFGERLLALKEAGVEFAIASGRPMATLKDMFKDYAGLISFVSDNGAAVSHYDEEIFYSEVDRPSYLDMIRYTKEKTKGYPILCAEEGAVTEPDSKPFENFYRRFYTNIHYVDDLLSVANRANKVSVYFPEKDSQWQLDHHYGPVFGQEFSATIGDDVWIDLMNKGIDKGAGIRQLGQALNIKLEHMMAFGDTFNDAEMLAAVGYSYRMANATEGMERYAKFVAPSNEEYGVIQVIDQVLAAKKAH
ncbi:HAD family phosphatase [Atopobacter sp. AH10]|uniref:HAD family hydrolase n=1 Tax=Atopobacter sp. AH10 TaxID=2315861 RepID=UPI000EF19178|nr:HAD family hydrolase [Atopobacter sp. AH10]RLK62689.1 HAD family phosphatase [Atopobacter sp. AH10]